MLNLLVSDFWKSLYFIEKCSSRYRLAFLWTNQMVTTSSDVSFVIETFAVIVRRLGHLGFQRENIDYSNQTTRGSSKALSSLMDKPENRSGNATQI